MDTKDARAVGKVDNMETTATGASQAVQTLTDLLLTPENLMIMVAAWFLVVIARRAAPAFFTRPFMVRMLPVLPTFLTLGLIWIPGLRPTDMTIGATLVLGLILGWGASNVHKILSQTVLGRDERIAHTKDPVEPQSGTETLQPAKEDNPSPPPTT